jgi:hypothetical protein
VTAFDYQIFVRHIFVRVVGSQCSLEPQMIQCRIIAVNVIIITSAFRGKVIFIVPIGSEKA